MAAINKFKKNDTQSKTSFGGKKPLSEHNRNEPNKVNKRSFTTYAEGTIPINGELEKKAKMQCFSIHKDNSGQEERRNASDESVANNHEDSSCFNGKKIMRKDREHVSNVEDYQSDILNYFFETEGKYLPSPNYMSHQAQINFGLRSALINWLVQVCEEFNMDTETLYRAVNYLDRVLTELSVLRDKLLLVGISALFIASKFEETQHKSVEKFVDITNNVCTKEQIKQVEKFQLKLLQFNLNRPTVYAFINIYSVMLKMPDELKYLALYMNELFLLDGECFLQYLPSKISAASIALARYNFGQPTWSVEHEKITKYSLIDLKEPMLNLYATFSYASDSSVKVLHAVKEKYSSQEKYKNISEMKALHFDELVFDELLCIHLDEKEK